MRSKTKKTNSPTAVGNRVGDMEVGLVVGLEDVGFAVATLGESVTGVGA